MQVKVFHAAFEESPVHIATVDAPESSFTDAREKEMMAVAYAYRWTQNISDSWSMKMPIDGNDRVTVVEPLHVDDEGKSWGHRSSAVGDFFEADGTLYKCAIVGFEPTDKIECGQLF